MQRRSQPDDRGRRRSQARLGCLGRPGDVHGRYADERRRRGRDPAHRPACERDPARRTEEVAREVRTLAGSSGPTTDAQAHAKLSASRSTCPGDLRSRGSASGLSAHLSRALGFHRSVRVAGAVSGAAFAAKGLARRIVDRPLPRGAGEGGRGPSRPHALDHANERRLSLAASGRMHSDPRHWRISCACTGWPSSLLRLSPTGLTNSDPSWSASSQSPLQLFFGRKVPMDGELTCEHLHGLVPTAYKCGTVWGIRIEVAGVSLYHQGSADLDDEQAAPRARGRLSRRGRGPECHPPLLGADIAASRSEGSSSRPTTTTSLSSGRG